MNRPTPPTDRPTSAEQAQPVEQAQPAEQPRREAVDVLVVGDTPAAKAAAEAARGLGARVARDPGADLHLLGRSGAGVMACSAVTSADGAPITSRTYLARAVVLATGTEPAVPPVLGLPDVRAFTTASLDEELAAGGARPESLLVLGGGPTGCAQAQRFAAEGTRVTVVEAAGRLLPAEEPTAAQEVTDALVAAGVRVLVGGTVTKVSPTLDGGVYAGTDVGGDVAATHLLLATGRRGRIAGLDLPAVGLAPSGSGFLPVDDALTTAVPGIFAAGDLTGLVEGDHADAVMGRIAATNAVHAARHAGRVIGLPVSRRGAHPPARWEAHASPVVVATTPTLARIGLTLAEAEADARWTQVRAHDGGSGAAGTSLRLITALATGGRRANRSASRVLVGATLVGPTAPEDVAMLALAVRARIPADLVASLALPRGTSGCAAVELLAEPVPVTRENTQVTGGTSVPSRIGPLR